MQNTAVTSLHVTQISQNSDTDTDTAISQNKSGHNITTGTARERGEKKPTAGQRQKVDGEGQTR